MSDYAEWKRLQADSERLDWMEAHPRDVGHASGYRQSKDCWTYRDSEHALHNARSLREAIDAARDPAVHAAISSEPEDGKLDEKGRCCGRKPMVYKGRYTLGGPHRYCPRCDRAYDLEENEQVPNWAWKPTKDGDWVRQTNRAAAISEVPK